MQFQFLHSRIHATFHGSPAIHPLKNTFKPFKFSVIQKPVIGNHVRTHMLNGSGKPIQIIFEQGVKVMCIILQGYLRILCTQTGQEVVVINIDNHPAVVVISGMKAFTTDPGDGMRVRKGVNSTV